MFKEIETKYRITSCTVPQFNSAIKNHMGESTFKYAASFDYYFSKENKFIRFRDGDAPELTIKRKSSEDNNFIRTEINQRIIDTSLEKVTAFCKLLDYEYHFQIYKSCFIYYFNNYNIVYYIVSNDNLEEQARFIEIEIDENSNLSPRESWALLCQVEKKLSAIVPEVTKKNRLKLSLYEMFAPNSRPIAS